MTFMHAALSKRKLLVAICESLTAIERKIDSMAVTLDDVVAKVTAQKAITDSVIALLGQLKSMLDAAGSDPAKLQALSDMLGSQDSALATAVTANTPGGPVVPPIQPPVGNVP